MVKLTLDLVSRCTSGYTKKKRDESMTHYLKRLTHLYLENKQIDEIGDDLASCKNLTVLYLYDNLLNNVPLLNNNQNITHLYLQSNSISKIENLSTLYKLSKLYLGGNKITVVEGLENLTSLQELHIESQHLPPGEKLLFDPRTMSGVAPTLNILNVSGNNLDSLVELSCLKNLLQLVANDNNLTDMKELANCLSLWTQLWRLDLSGNPLCIKSKYRDRVIIMSPALEVLDHKEVSDTAKQFLISWQANKEKRRKDNSNKKYSNQIKLDTQSQFPATTATAPLTHGPTNSLIPALPRKHSNDTTTHLPNSSLEAGKVRPVSMPGTEGVHLNQVRLGHTLNTEVDLEQINRYGTLYVDEKESNKLYYDTPVVT